MPITNPRNRAISETRQTMLHCDLRVRWKVASNLRFRAAISEPKTPFFCGISGDLALSTRKSLAIAIVRFWCAKFFCLKDIIEGGLCPSPSTWGPPDNGSLSACSVCSCLAATSSASALSGLCLSSKYVWIIIACRPSDGTMALGVIGKLRYPFCFLRFRGGWEGGEAPRGLSVPFSPKSALQSNRGVPWAPSPLMNR